MLTVEIKINGKTIVRRTARRESKAGANKLYTYRLDDGSTLDHYYDEGAVALARLLLDRTDEPSKTRKTMPR